MNPNIAAYMGIAEDCLQDAQVLFQESRYRGVVGRAYYAYFDAVKALLATKDITTKSHSAARALFGEHFIKNGPYQKQDATALHRLFNLRQDAEYEPGEEVTSLDAQNAIETAAEFLLQVEAYLKQNGFAA